MTRGSQQMNWAQHHNKWNDCKRCPLHKDRHKAVLGMGRIKHDEHPGAPILAFGQHPGKEEDLIGLPMQGQGGSWVFWAITKIAMIKWSDCFFSNILGCKPLGSPKKKQIDICSPRVYELIDMVDPKVILSMGKTAGTFFTDDRNFKISESGGTARLFRGRDIFFTVHPFDPARQKTVAAKKAAEERVIREYEAFRAFCIERGIVERTVE